VRVKHRATVVLFCLFACLLFLFNHRKFAEGKQNCTNIARKSCSGICEDITKDAYNPFCDSDTDPADTSDLSGRITFVKCFTQLSRPGACLLKFPKSLRTRKAIAKSQTL